MDDWVMARMKAAQKRRGEWDSLLDEAMKYAMPDHEGYDTARTPGSRRHQHVFDSTAIESLFNRAKRDHSILCPAGYSWMEFILPNLGKGDAETRRLGQKYLDECQRRFMAAIDASNFHLALEPALREAHISTGVLAVHEGTPDKPLVFECVPISEIAPEPALDGTLKSSYRTYSRPGYEIKAKYPQAKLPPWLEDQIAKDENASIKVCDALVWKEDHQEFLYRVYAMNSEGTGESALLVDHAVDSPARICFRMDVAAGEWMGRGPVMAMLSTIKSANKTVELILKNASIAVSGMYQADDDGVLHPGTIKLQPGIIVPKAVGSAGLQPIQSGAQFDVSEMVLRDLRTQIREGIEGPSMPPAELGGRRSAEEISSRMMLMAQMEVPRTLRPQRELMVPLAERVLAILQSPSMKGSPYYIAPFSAEFLPLTENIQPQPVPPAAQLRKKQEAMEALQALQQGMAVAPELVMQEIDVGPALRDQLAVLGIPAKYQKTEAQKQQERQQAQAMMLAQMQAEGQEAT